MPAFLNVTFLVTLWLIHSRHPRFCYFAFLIYQFKIHEGFCAELSEKKEIYVCTLLPQCSSSSRARVAGQESLSHCGCTNSDNKADSDSINPTKWPPSTGLLAQNGCSPQSEDPAGSKSGLLTAALKQLWVIRAVRLLPSSAGAKSKSKIAHVPLKFETHCLSEPVGLGSLSGLGHTYQGTLAACIWQEVVTAERWFWTAEQELI